MAKKVKIVLKLNLPAGKANPAPPIGPALGQHGVALMEFCQAYNERTKQMQGIVPAVITIYEDRSFEFELKKAPVAEMIRNELNLKKGSQTPGRESVATMSQKQLEKIAQEKMDDLNANDIEAAKKVVAGTARSMGIKVE
jgi:large subunit ribosomal protein L11